ncbi:MAG TPA: hypothetical protein VLM91_24555, partial [Candidatus Methylomirabilis sp.]|nr:hypothetical protein [Candidatus Methylomirabilis sp.]
MTLDRLVQIANAAYSDDLVWQYHRHPKRKFGDGLAKFIAEEIGETYEADAPTEQQLAEAVRVITS